jgi:hypothetical protein
VIVAIVPVRADPPFGAVFALTSVQLAPAFVVLKTWQLPKPDTVR